MYFPARATARAVPLASPRTQDGKRLGYAVFGVCYGTKCGRGVRSFGMAAMRCAAIRTMALIEPGMNRSTKNITVAVIFRFDSIAQGMGLRVSPIVRR